MFDTTLGGQGEQSEGDGNFSQHGGNGSGSDVGDDDLRSIPRARISTNLVDFYA